MLSKLFRQEIRAHGKTITGLYGALVAATLLIIGLFYLCEFTDRKLFHAVFMIGCMFYMVTIVVIAVVVFIYLCFHFYKSMYSEQGYLTHTLPVKTTQILNVKVAVSFGFLFVTAILCALSFCAIGMAAEGISIVELIEILGKAIADMADAMHISGFAYVLMLLAGAVLGCLNALLLFFAGSSIGQLAHRSKGACGIAAGIGLYYVSQILSLAGIFIGYLLYEALPAIRNVTFITVGACLLAFGWTMIYYMICRVIVRKHLNLE